MITLEPKCFDDWYRERFALSDNMSSCYGHMPELANFLLEEYREKCQNSRLLGIEFGCGDGRFACEFIKTFSHFTVTDKYDFSLKRTCQRAGKFADRLSTFQHIHGEPNDKVWQGFLDNNKEKFDLVITANMFHYLTDEKVSVVLDEANSLLRNGGILYVCFESDIRLSAAEVEFKMPGQTDCNGERIVKIAEESGFECARKQISLLGEKIFSLPKSAQAFLGVESTHYTRNICLHEYIFIKNTTEGYRSESIFPYNDYALHASDSNRKMKDVQEQILNLARNTVSNLKGKTPFEICNGLKDGWNDILRLYSKDDRSFRAVHLKYHNLDIDETTMAESKSEKNRSGAREYIFPAINWSSLLFKENARYSSASFCVIEDADNEDEAGKDSFFIGNHMSLSLMQDCPKCFKRVIDMCKDIGLGSGDEDSSRDVACSKIVVALNDVLSAYKNRTEILSCIDRWRDIAKKSMCYDLESAILEIIDNDADFWGYKNVHGKFIPMTKPRGFSDLELWIIVFFFKIFLSSVNIFIAMAVDGLGSGGGAAQTGAFLTGQMPSKFHDKKDELIYKGLFIKSCDYALAVIRRYQLELVNRKKLIYALNSAVGSIMSRNGSHNIGSHVLADLSHNVGTMPDDRVLYQYIQHRMDYIATATTEFPAWSQPLPLVGNVVKNFLIQRHLLDHITGSEGLHAYQFQNEKVPTSCDVGLMMNGNEIRECQPATVRIHARRIKDGVEWNETTHFRVCDTDVVDFIPYPTGNYGNDDGKKSLLSNDVEVAIPGGVVGRHAFYTIVENVLRNAAKHEWSRLNEDSRKLNCLDVYIDFKDAPFKGVVEVVVWTDSKYSAQNYAIEALKNPDCLSPSDIKDRLATERGGKPLNLVGLQEHEKLQVRIARSFVAEDGQLRKENWGLAEMRISAGYLNVSDIADIGGINDSDLRFELIKPVMVENGAYYCLGYHFDVPKPKELLIVVPQSVNVDENIIHKAHAILMQYGVGVMSEKDVLEESCRKEKNSKLSYAYILLKSFKKKDGCPRDNVDPDDMRTWKFPFRIVTENHDRLEPLNNDKVDRRADYVYSDNENVFDSIEQKLRMASASNQAAQNFAIKVLSDIYRSWVRHLKQERFNNSRAVITLTVDVNKESAGDGKDGKGGKDLVSDADLLKIVFENCFDKAVDSFCRMRKAKGMEIDSRLDATLSAMKRMCPRIVGISKVFFDEDDKECPCTVKEMIQLQLIDWCDAICRNSHGADIDTESITLVSANLNSLFEGTIASSSFTGLDDFIFYLETTILPQSRVFLSMYEEKFATLPKALASANDLQSKEVVDALDGQEITPANTDDAKSNLVREEFAPYVIAYWRHEDFRSGRNCCYLEPLSGAQSYLASFECIKTDSIERTRFIAKLIENGLSRVLIIDERVKRFVDNHTDVQETFNHIGIATLDDTSPEVNAIFCDQAGCLDGRVGFPAVEISSYDILIIHQGIIDKKLKDCESVKSFIERLKCKIRYVVVTTGRGSPANIPPDVRVLPFSVVESTLFKKYPEKMILVDAVMNILPMARKENVCL